MWEPLVSLLVRNVSDLCHPPLDIILDLPLDKMIVN